MSSRLWASVVRFFKNMFSPLPRKDTIRLILFTECNMSCYYCCNENEKFSSQFLRMRLEDIDFSPYKNVCISGGEPFLYPQTVLDVILWHIPKRMNIYIYTNGVLLTHQIICALFRFNNIKGINVGIHNHLQLKQIPRSLDIVFGNAVRYHIQDTKLDSFKKKEPYRLAGRNIKLWHKDDCDLPNEEWVALIDLPKEKGDD